MHWHQSRTYWPCKYTCPSPTSILLPPWASHHCMMITQPPWITAEKYGVSWFERTNDHGKFSRQLASTIFTAMWCYVTYKIKSIIRFFILNTQIMTQAVSNTETPSNTNEIATVIQLMSITELATWIAQAELLLKANCKQLYCWFSGTLYTATLLWQPSVVSLLIIV